jgi:hypothetical protein
MSEGEIEVEAVSGYEVLPKDVLAEVGSVKLFSTCDRTHASAAELHLLQLVENVRENSRLTGVNYRPMELRGCRDP